MKGRIDEHGLLEIYRGDENPDHYQKQYCPYQPFMNQDGVLKPVQCGSWCPLFGGPFTRQAVLNNGENHSMVTIEFRSMVTIELCGGNVLMFDYFEDKRYD